MSQQTDLLKAILSDKHSTDAERALANQELIAPQADAIDASIDEDAKSMWIGLDHSRYLRIKCMIEQGEK